MSKFHVEERDRYVDVFKNQIAAQTMQDQLNFNAYGRVTAFQ